MNYPLDDPEDIISWSSIFEALSIRQFDEFAEEVGFPGKPTDDLRRVAQSFTLSFEQYLGNKIPEPPPIQLLSETDQGDPLNELWRNTMNHLEKIGFADIVYEWGKSTYHNYHGEEHWLIHGGGDWDGLLLTWAMEPDRSELLPLMLSEKTVTSLQLTVLRYMIKYFRIRTRIDLAKESKLKNEWEHYAFEVLGVGTWLSNQANFIIHLAKWKAIFELLSDDELKIVEAWGWQVFEKINSPERIPLVRVSL